MPVDQVTAATWIMRVFTTVGSTKFDALVNVVLSEPVLRALRLRGYSTLVIQSGNSQVGVECTGSTTTLHKDGLEVEIWKFKPSLKDEFESADLVISHAGKYAQSKYCELKQSPHCRIQDQVPF